MVLQPDGAYWNALGLEFLDQGQRTFTLGFVLKRVIVVAQNCVRVGFMRILKSLFNVIVANDSFPRRFAQSSIFIQGLVHDIPALDPALVPANDGLDMVVHPFQKRFAVATIRAVVGQKNPFGSLTVPDQRVADDIHPILHAKFDVTVARLEIIAVVARTGEWRLVKGMTIFGTLSSAAFITAPALNVAGARLGKARIFAVFFHGPGFLSSRPFWHRIGGDDAQQLPPEIALFTNFAGPADLRQHQGPLAKGIERAFEADPFQGRATYFRRLGHDPTEQVMSDEEDQQFFLDHGWGATA